MLTQIITVGGYQTNSKLSLPESFVFQHTSFSDVLSREVQALQQISLIQAIIQEDKYTEMRKYQRFSSTYNTTYHCPTAHLLLIHLPIK